MFNLAGNKSLILLIVYLLYMCSNCYFLAYQLYADLVLATVSATFFQSFVIFLYKFNKGADLKQYGDLTVLSSILCMSGNGN